jgi:hypothetical protein
MSGLFIKTNKFLKEYQENLNLEVEKLFQSSYDEYFNTDYAEEELTPWLWEKPNEYYLRGAGLEYKQIFEKEHKELNDRGLFFHYCKFKTYERTYKDRLNNFIEKYEDADPVYFLQDELKEYLKPIDFQNPFKYLDSEQQNVLSYTRDRTVRFLVEQAKTIGYNIIINIDEFELTMSYKIEDTKSEKESILSDTIKQPLSEKEKWLPIGLGFAKGEIQKDLKKNISARKIANKHTKESDANYVTGTGITLPKDPKNIYSDLKKMKIVFVHCIENDIIVCDEFKKAYDIKLRELN